MTNTSLRNAAAASFYAASNITIQLSKSVSYFNDLGSTGFLLRNTPIISDSNLDIIVYLDIGMDTGSTLWAHSRFAPIQMALWGHPVTTGMESIDYFLVNDDFESDHGVDRYNEQLVRFDWLTFTFPEPTYVDSALSGSFSLLDYGVPLDSKIVMIPQSMQKFHLEFDDFLDGVLGLGDDVYIVAVYESKKTLWKDMLHLRFVEKMGKEKAERFKFIPTLPPEEFFLLTSLATVVVDPYPFGGGVTSLEIFQQCKVIVTVPGEQSVPALTKGMYVEMGVEDFIVEDWSRGVEVVEKVLRDEELRKRGEDKICSSKAKIYDVDGSAEFESWAKTIVNFDD